MGLLPEWIRPGQRINDRRRGGRVTYGIGGTGVLSTMASVDPVGREPKEVKPSRKLRESLSSQLIPAFAACYEVSRICKQPPVNKTEVAKAVRGSLTTEVVAYMVGEMELNPELVFSLVVTPNKPVDPEIIADLIRNFAHSQPKDGNRTVAFRHTIAEDLLNRYTGEQLSGADPQNPSSVRVSFIPNMCPTELNGTVEQQIAGLEELKAACPPGLGLEAPSVLEAITRWYVLRGSPNSITGAGGVNDPNLTTVGHFGLPPIDGAVLCSSVPTSGNPDLSNLPLDSVFASRPVVRASQV